MRDHLVSGNAITWWKFQAVGHSHYLQNKKVALEAVRTRSDTLDLSLHHVRSAFSHFWYPLTS